VAAGAPGDKDLAIGLNCQIVDVSVDSDGVPTVAIERSVKGTVHVQAGGEELAVTRTAHEQLAVADGHAIHDLVTAQINNYLAIAATEGLVKRTVHFETQDSDVAICG
jgi:hypothetical protein